MNFNVTFCDYRFTKKRNKWAVRLKKKESLHKNIMFLNKTRLFAYKLIAY